MGLLLENLILLQTGSERTIQISFMLIYILIVSLIADIQIFFLQQNLPEIEWHKGHSGVLIEDAAVVEKLILTIVKKVCSIRKPNTLIAYEREDDNQMIENLGDYIRDLCPVFKKRVIESKKLTYRDFKEGEVVEDSFIDFEFDEKLVESLSENVSDEDLIKVLNPIA